MSSEAVRIDKWLWAARFFKTRGLATEAIKGGKVSVNGHRIKPSRDVHIGDELRIRQGYNEKTVIVRGISDRRGPAPVAQQLYEETAESQQAREEKKTLHQMAAAQRPRGQGRPTKRERRQLNDFTRNQD
jgi:ribosome-associated heat shock protein Hsp15